MSNISVYLKNKLLDHVTGKAAFTEPSQLYLAFLTTSSTDTVVGTEVTSTTVHGYVRTPISPSVLGSASGGSILNTGQILGPLATAGGTDPTVTSWALFDALTSGNYLWFGDLPSSFEWKANIQPIIAPSDFDLSIV